MFTRDFGQIAFRFDAIAKAKMIVEEAINR